MSVRGWLGGVAVISLVVGIGAAQAASTESPGGGDQAPKAAPSASGSGSSTAAAPAGSGKAAAEKADKNKAAKLDAVVVTTRKRAENLQKVPIAVTAFTAAQMEQRAMQGLDDIARSTPGFTFEGFSTGASGNPTIRGLANTFTVSRIQNTAVFLNNVYLQRQGMLNPGLVDMERVEVVKGPQSALYGRNAFAGAINYVTKEPADQFGGDVGTNIGDGERRDYHGSLNFPLVKDMLQLRVSGALSEYDGHTDNTNPGAPIEGQVSDSSGRLGGWKDQIYTAGLNFTPTRDLTIKLDDYSADIFRKVQPYYVIDGAKAVANGFSNTNYLNCNVATVTGFQPGTQATGNTLWCGELPAVNPVIGRMTVDPRGIGLDAHTNISTLRSDWKLGAGYTVSDVVGHASYNGFQNGGDGDPNPEIGSNVSGTNYDMFRGSPIESLHSISNEFRVRWDNGGAWTAGGGVYYEDEKDSEQTYLWYAPVCNAQNLGNCSFDVQNSPFPSSLQKQINLLNFILKLPLPPTVKTQLEQVVTTLQGVGTTGPRGSTEYADEIISPFAEVSYDFAKTLKVHLEGRYNVEEKSIHGLTDDNGMPIDYRDSANEYFFAPRLTVEWQPTPFEMNYFSVADGVKTGGFNNVDNNQQKTYQPEKNRTWEIGSKNLFFDRRLKLNVAAYYVQWRDIQGQEVNQDDAQQARQVVGNIGDGKTLGLEIESTVKMPYGVSVDLGASWIDPKYKNANYQDAYLNWACNGITCASDGNVSGNQIARTSREQFLGALNYQHSLPWDWSMRARFDTSYQSRQYADPLNTAYLPGRTLSNFTLSAFSPDHWMVNFWVKNLFAQHYAESAFVVPQFNRYIVAVGAPRELGVSLSYSF